MSVRRSLLPRARREYLLASVAALAMPAIIIRAEAQPPNLKAIADALKEATDKFNAKSEELTKTAATAMAEVANKGALLAETKTAVDKLILEQTVLTGEKNKLQSQLSDAEARLAGLETEISGRRVPGQPARPKSLGQQMVEDPALKAWARGSGTRGKHRFEVQASTTSLNYPTSEPSIIAPYVVPGIQSQPKQRLFIRDLIPVVGISSPLYSWIRKTGFTNRAEVVSEGTRKPESEIAFDVQSKPVTTIAHIFKASKQLLDDFKALRGEVDIELRYGLKYVEEQEILFGDGTGIHLLGIVPQATAFSAAFEPFAHQRIDDIRLAMLQSQLARRPATGIVMHFVDWAHIELTKDANGQYLFANPLRLATETLWGLPVVPTEINDFESHFLVGGFATGARILDREEMGVEVATENEDDFVKNMITIRCEERVGLAVMTPESFIWGQFAAGSGT